MCKQNLQRQILCSWKVDSPDQRMNLLHRTCGTVINTNFGNKWNQLHLHQRVVRAEGKRIEYIWNCCLTLQWNLKSRNVYRCSSFFQVSVREVDEYIKGWMETLEHSTRLLKNLNMLLLFWQKFQTHKMQNTASFWSCLYGHKTIGNRLNIVSTNINKNKQLLGSMINSNQCVYCIHDCFTFIIFESILQMDGWFKEI